MIKAPNCPLCLDDERVACVCKCHTCTTCWKRVSVDDIDLYKDNPTCTRCISKFERYKGVVDI